MRAFDMRAMGVCLGTAMAGVVGCGGAEAPDAAENVSAEQQGVTCPASCGANRYEVTDLGSLSTEPGDTYITVGRLGERRVVVGLSDSRAYRWRNGTMAALDTLGGSLSAAHAVNDAGLIVGESFMPDTGSNAVVWRNGSIRALGTLGGRYSAALDVNARGDIAGYSTINEANDFHAFIYTAGVMRDLGSLGGGQAWSWAYAINSRAHVVGFSYDPNQGGEFATYWHDGVVEALAGLEVTSHAWDINDRGQIVGDLGTRAFLYTAGEFTDIGAPGAVTAAFAVNNHGQIVGYTSHDEPERPDLSGPEGFLFTDGHLELLRNLVDTCWDVMIPADINDRGAIAAVAYACEGELKRHALLLEPRRGCTPPR